MSNADTLTEVLNTKHASPDIIGEICIDLVRSWSGGKTVERMDTELHANARDPIGIDGTLAQLRRDPDYAENAALVVLSAAWNYPNLHNELQALVSQAPKSPDRYPTSVVGAYVLYGLYMLVQDDAKFDHVAYRNAGGRIDVAKTDTASATALFDAVRNQYSPLP